MNDDKPEIVVFNINFEEYARMMDSAAMGSIERMMLERAAQAFARRLITHGFIVSRTTTNEGHETVRFHFEMAAVKPKPYTEREFRQAPVEELDQLAADGWRKTPAPAAKPAPPPDPTGLSPAQKAALDPPKTPGSQWLTPFKDDNTSD